MLKCGDCGYVFHEEDIAYWKEDRGWWQGERVSEEMCGCPNCHGDYYKAFKCKECEEYFFDEIEDGLCEECREKE